MCGRDCMCGRGFMCGHGCACVGLYVWALPHVDVAVFLTFRRRLPIRGITGLAETFPSFPVSGTFLPDVPGFQYPPE